MEAALLQLPDDSRLPVVLRDVLDLEYADIADQLERKVSGISLYASQLDRLFGGRDAMADAVRGFGARTAAHGGLPGAAERYWVTTGI